MLVVLSMLNTCCVSLFCPATAAATAATADVTAATAAAAAAAGVPVC